VHLPVNTRSVYFVRHYGADDTGETLGPRSDLKNIRGRAGGHFFLVQGERNVVDPGSISDEQRMWKYELWPRPFGLHPGIGANGVARLEIE